jgi:ATP-binding cassette subfamily C protein CydCD
LDGPVEIELDAIALRHEHAEGVFLANVQATFAPGHLHAIVGPSGSGKSSLMRTLLGLHVPAAGSVRIRTAEGVYVLGEELTATHWLGHCAYVSQHPFLFRGTVADNLTLRVPELKVDAERAEAWVRRLGLEGCLGPDPLRFVLSEGGSNLSGGQQQRLALLRALHLNRPVLLVDEVTSALDPALREDVLAVLREEADRGVNVLIVTHDSDLAAACDTHVDLAHYPPPSPGWNPS